jgi:hypothetical protein
MGCAQGSETSRRDNPTRALTKSHLGEYRARTVNCKTVYATMQPAPPLPPSASMGVDGAGPGLGALEVMAKCETKKSIGVVCTWCAGWDAKKLSEDQRYPAMLAFCTEYLSWGHVGSLQTSGRRSWLYYNEIRVGTCLMRQ